MSCDVSGTEDPAARGAEILAAREARERLIRGLAAQVPGSLAFVTTNIPGAEKCRFGLQDLVERAIAMLGDLIAGCEVIDEGSGPLGPHAGIACPDSSVAVKRAAVQIEDSVRGGRLLDVDVYDVKGRAFGRAKLGLAPRGCIVCAEPAFDCIRVGRHTPEELEEAVRELIARAQAG
jgi:holo-ACP synthase